MFGWLRGQLESSRCRPHSKNSYSTMYIDLISFSLPYLKYWLFLLESLNDALWKLQNAPMIDMNKVGHNCWKALSYVVCACKGLSKKYDFHKLDYLGVLIHSQALNCNFNFWIVNWNFLVLKNKNKKSISFPLSWVKA